MTKTSVKMAALGMGLWVLLIVQLPSELPAQNPGESEIQRGFDINTLALTLAGRNRGLVGLGSYYVNGVSDCTGCHTANLGGGVAFGPFVSRNLTPDASGRPAALTLAEFKQEIRTGVDLKQVADTVPDSPDTLQVMPWPAYRHATERWLDAIYEYLRSIPCVEGGPGTVPNRCAP